MDSVALAHKAVLERELQTLKLQDDLDCEFGKLQDGDVDVKIVTRWIESRLKEIESD